jgi:transcriptional regulator with XRE-family HTH domain
VQLPRLKEWREFRGLTQPELAERAGLSLRTVFNYEHEGNALPNNARKLAEALGIEVGDLISEEAHPKGSAPLSQPSFNHLLAEERRTQETIRESEHLKTYVRGNLERWGRVARGEDPHLAPDYAYAIEVLQHVISLTDWCGELLRAIKADLPPEAAASERRKIVQLIDSMGEVATEIGAIANAAEGMTFKAVDEELTEEEKALINAEVAAFRSKQNPADNLAELRSDKATKRYVALREAQQNAAQAKRRAVGE